MFFVRAINRPFGDWSKGWICVGCGVTFWSTPPAQLAAPGRAYVCDPCVAWAAKWNPPVIDIAEESREDDQDFDEVEGAVQFPSPELVEKWSQSLERNYTREREAAVAYLAAALETADGFTVKEDLAILLGEKTGMPIDETAYKLERPDDEVQKRLDKLCPKPRDKEKIGAAMDRLRLAAMSGARP